jgi:hypothetical protein
MIKMIDWNLPIKFTGQDFPVRFSHFMKHAGVVKQACVVYTVDGTDYMVVVDAITGKKSTTGNSVFDILNVKKTVTKWVNIYKDSGVNSFYLGKMFDSEKEAFNTDPKRLSTIKIEFEA